MDAVALAADLRAGRVGSGELVADALDRAAADRLGAFVTLTAELALAAADEADRRLVAARRDGTAADLPALLGVPTAVKDLTPVAGVRTTYGSATRVGFVPEHSAEVVLRMERAGLVGIGKTNTPEFGAPCYTEPDVAPPARTPWDPSRSAGGSSGGAAVAVASGILALAHGSDGGGSLRIPASVCGLVGFKASRGLVSSAPNPPDLLGMATSGCLSRTVRDTAAFLDAVAGPAAGDATWARRADLTAALDVDPGPLRIGRCAVPVLGDGGVDPRVVAAFDATSALLAQLGHDVVDVDLALPEPVRESLPTVWGIGFAAAVVDPGDEHLLRPLTRWLRATGDLPARVVAVAQAAARQAAFDLTARTAELDAVLTPTLASLPVPVGALRDDADPAADFAAQTAFTPWTALWNLTGAPAVSLPLEQADGLPVGMMLAGRPGQDAALVSLAASVERARPWARRLPPAPRDGSDV